MLYDPKGQKGEIMNFVKYQKEMDKATEYCEQLEEMTVTKDNVFDFVRIQQLIIGCYQRVNMLWLKSLKERLGA